jgi:hypothetical protein
VREDELRLLQDKERDVLLNVQRGERPWTEVNAWRLRLLKELDEAFASTELPGRPDYNWANEFLLKARKQMDIPLNPPLNCYAATRRYATRTESTAKRQWRPKRSNPG